MLRFLRWDDVDAITHNHLIMRDEVIAPEDNIGLDEVISR
jgi:hypothetical protein